MSHFFRSRPKPFALLLLVLMSHLFYCHSFARGPEVCDIALSALYSENIKFFDLTRRGVGSNHYSLLRIMIDSQSFKQSHDSHGGKQKFYTDVGMCSESF